MHSPGHSQPNTAIIKRWIEMSCRFAKADDGSTYSRPWRNFPLWLNALSSTHFRFRHKRWLLPGITIRWVDLLALFPGLFFVGITRIQSHTNTLTWPRSNAAIHRTLQKSIIIECFDRTTRIARLTGDHRFLHLKLQHVAVLPGRMFNGQLLMLLLWLSSWHTTRRWRLQSALHCTRQTRGKVHKTQKIVKWINLALARIVKWGWIDNTWPQLPIRHIGHRCCAQLVILIGLSSWMQ